jgi:hypothetical protein
MVRGGWVRVSGVVVKTGIIGGFVHLPNKVTLVVTANGRPELLKRTLDSFHVFNTYPIEQELIRDDSVDHVGQIKSCEILYGQVHTPYVFHCEDDWEFHKKGFIEEAFNQLEDKVHSVWVRDEDDFDGYHRVKPLTNGKWVVPSPISTGFSFNPHLYDMQYYDGFTKTGGVCPEDSIGRYYQAGGLKTIWIPGYCKHLGGDQ